MRYLKLFESFSQDFSKSVRDLEKQFQSERRKLFNDTKAKVDEFMFDLTDDFSNEKEGQVNFIDSVREGIEIWYYLKCNKEDIDKFMELLKDVNERLNDELGLGIGLEVKAYPIVDKHRGDVVPNTWIYRPLDEMVKYIDSHKIKTHFRYSHFNFKILVSEI